MSSLLHLLLNIAVAFLVADHVIAQATVTSTQTISLPTSRPSDAFKVPADFPSIGFETAFLSDYDNDFSNNLIASLGSRMDVKPVIRIGGTSGDRIEFNPNQTEPAICVAKPCDTDANFTLGKTYFNALATLTSARFTIQAPLSDGIPNRTLITEYVRRAYNTAGAPNIDALALGNEVNVYENNAAQYVADALAAKNAITSALNLADTPIWEIADTSSNTASSTTRKPPYTIEQLFTAGINADKKVKYVAEHYYQFDGATPGIQTQLLNHTALVSKLAAYETSIKYTRHNTSSKYILSETGGVLGVSDDRQTLFAATLWGVNFNMYAMTRGVSRVSGVQHPEAKRSLWIPEAGLRVPGPRVQAPYYALPFVADFVGKDVGGDRGVVNIDLGSEVVSAYGMFEGERMKRVGIVNLREYDGSGGRSAVKVRLEGPGSASEVQVGRLHAAAGTAAGGFDVNAKNITWEGQQWSYGVDGGKGHGSVSRTTLRVVSGAVDIVVPDSEALIVYT